MFFLFLLQRFAPGFAGLLRLLGRRATACRSEAELVALANDHILGLVTQLQEMLRRFKAGLPVFDEVEAPVPSPAQPNPSPKSVRRQPGTRRRLPRRHPRPAAKNVTTAARRPRPAMATAIAPAPSRPAPGRRKPPAPD